MKTTPQPAEGSPARRSVEVHIEELVLHGFAPGDRRRIAGTVEQELARLIGERGLPESFENPLVLERLKAGAFHVSATAKAQATGTEIAQAVYRSFAPRTRPAAGTRAGGPGTGIRHA